MVTVCYRLGSISHLGGIPLGMTMRALLETFNGIQTYRDCGEHYPGSGALDGSRQENELSTSIHFFLLPDGGCTVTSCFESMTTRDSLYLPTSCQNKLFFSLGYFHHSDEKKKANECIVLVSG